MELKYYDRNIRTNKSYNWQIQDHAELAEGEVPYIEFPALKRLKGVKHCFSTRLGGVSTGSCASMNLAENCGDTREKLLENFRRMGRILGITPDEIVLSDQVHGIHVQAVSKQHAMGEQMEKKVSGADGIMTDTAGIALATSYADCVPLLFADPVKGVVAGVHAGWRGTAGLIGKHAVDAMTGEYGTNPEDIIAVIGPSICQECYEVSEEVADEFYRAFEELICQAVEESKRKETMNRVMDAILAKNGQKEGKYQLDLWMANRIILEFAGIPGRNISVACVCTSCNSALLHSHRATGGKRGGLRAFIMKVE